MARWQLTAKHYLNVPGTEWEHTEQNRDTGRSVRKRFTVPRYLDPDNPGDFNYPGEIIVCHEDKGQARDIIFVGPPTPDMTPIDAEAEAISKTESKNWVMPLSGEALPGQGFGESLAEQFGRELEKIMARQPLQQVTNVSAGQVSMEQFLEMQRQIAELTAKLNGAEPIEDDAEPLPPAETIATPETLRQPARR